jgi:exonuclease SbcC
MRPQLLKIAGLNSFVEEEVIDFASLAKKGLFGIFGPTGSGKSSILDAITIALYGKISRDTKEFINKDAEELYVYFKFTLGQNVYIVERKMQISKAGGYKTSLARLVMKENEEEKIFDKVNEIDDKIAEVIGLSHEDFMRTVVLPQGKFSRFLKLTGRKRRDMLERILDLQEFGDELMGKLKKQRTVRKDRTREINAVLHKYQDISEESLKEEKKELEVLDKKYTKVLANLKEKKIVFDKYKSVRKLQQELKDYKKKQEELAGNKEEIKEQKARLKKVKRAVTIKSEIERYMVCKKKTVDNKKALEEIKQDITKLSKEKEQFKEQYNNLVEKKERELPKLTEKKVKIESALEIEEKNYELQEKIDTHKQEVDRLQEEQKKLGEELKQIKQTIDQKITIINDKEEEVDDLQVSSDYRKAVTAGLELENNYKKSKEQLSTIIREKETLKEKIEGKQNKADRLKEELKSIEAQIMQNYDQKIRKKQEKKNELSINLKNMEEEVEDKKKSLDNITQEIKDIERKNMAGILAQQLNEEESCPVCGSDEHPELAEEMDLDLTQKNKNKDELEEAIDSLQQNINKVNADINIIDNHIESLNKEKASGITSFNGDREDLMEIDCIDCTDPTSLIELKRDRGKIKEKINKLKGSLNQNKEDINQKKKKLKNMQKDIKQLKKQYNKELEKLAIDSFAKVNKQISEKDKQLEEVQKTLKKAKKKLKAKEKKEKGLREKINRQEKELIQDKNELDKLEEDFAKNVNEMKEKVGERNPKKYLQEVERNEKELKNNVEEKKKELELRKEQYNDKQNIKSTIEDRLGQLNEEIDDLKVLLDKKIDEFNLTDIDEVKNYLEWEEKVEKWQDEIKKYEKKETDINNNIKRITEELDGESITKEEWEDIKKEKSTLEKDQEVLREKIGGQKTEIAKLEENLNDKKIKEEKKDKLDHELSLIKEINDLVRGKSFVEFVAIRQLRYIAREASKRLMEITNNRYKLELNEQGEFVICDLYNGGVKRGCNTLSGGETFLSSLSLALALSSQIQLKGSSNMEFFFLDEGFGTLDANLLDIVMNSLEELQDEDLAVGIISHVEELKNRVPVKLLVEPAEPGISGTEVNIEYS